jgi:hypothetical protein
MLPEGNREEFRKYVEHSGNNFKQVLFVKNVDEAFNILFADYSLPLDLNMLIDQEDYRMNF